MDYDETEINVNLELLGEYNIEKGKNYQYINVDTLSFDLKNAIIEKLENTNEMPNNFLKFVYETNLDNLRTIYSEEQINDDNKDKTEYIVNADVSKAYKENRFGLIIKVNEDNKDEQQLVLYCQKTQRLFHQFFLRKELNTKKYLSDLEISLPSSSQTSKNIQENNNETNMNKINPEGNKIEQDNSKDMFSVFKEEKKLGKYIKGHAFECEVCVYLRKKICMDEKNHELPNVFYTLKNIKVKNGTKETFFYNEFDSIFLIENDVEFDKSVFKINCKFENSLFDDTKLGSNETIKLKGKNLVFVECKVKAKFSKIFEELFPKIYKFRSLIDNIFGTKDYGVIILYLYDNEFIYCSDDFSHFQTAVNNGFDTCKNQGIEGIDKFNIYAFYIYDNVYMHNYSSIQDEVDELKRKQDIMEKKIEAMMEELKRYRNNNVNNNNDSIKIENKK